MQPLQASERFPNRRPAAAPAHPCRQTWYGKQEIGKPADPAKRAVASLVFAAKGTCGGPHQGATGRIEVFSNLPDVLKGLRMKIAPSRPHQLIKDLCAFAVQDTGKRRDDLMLSRCLAVRNVVKCIPEPLKAHFADHWFGYRPGCTRDLNIEGVNREQHGTCRDRCCHAGIKSIRIALGDDVRHRLKAHF